MFWRRKAPALVFPVLAWSLLDNSFVNLSAELSSAPRVSTPKDCSNLALLTQQCRRTDALRHITCVVLGNYYSVLKKNKNAFINFHRALDVNPFYSRAWTLSGHELIELRQFTAALFCYWRAIRINKSDYRAWYGLANVFELMKINEYCLPYYINAHTIKTDDHRFLNAIGDICVASGRYDMARHAYWKCYMLPTGDRCRKPWVGEFYIKKITKCVGNRQDLARIHLEMVDRMDCSSTDRVPTAVERSALKFLKTYAENNMDQALVEYTNQKEDRFSSIAAAEIKSITRRANNDTEFLPSRALRKIHHSLRKSYSQETISSMIASISTNVSKSVSRSSTNE
ncbi:hypothetical protein ACOME3_005258 [Neoechinorhynchus agilis]